MFTCLLINVYKCMGEDIKMPFWEWVKYKKDVIRFNHEYPKYNSG